jgi:magnesium-transporting ATPase (P-type)
MTRAPWHAMTPDAVRAALGVHAGPGGLDGAQVAAQRERHGPNTLPIGTAPSLLSVVLHQLRSPLIYILLAAAGVALAMRDVVDAGFILFVVASNTALGTFQEWRAEQSAAHLQRLITTRVRVVRDGRDQSVDATELVPGDLVRLESGQRVAADLRLLEATALTADESLLTGESVAAEKDVAACATDAPMGDRRNMAFAGATIMTGRALGLVVATGRRTEVGAIAEAVSGTESAKPPLVVRLERFSRQISLVVLVACAIIAGIGIGRGMPWLDVFLLAVALAVSAIPEGLPVAVTVALSIATRRMAKRHVIVRRLTAVEGLGSCTFIASDKTGTLTVNRQTLRRVLLPDGTAFSLDGEGYAPHGHVRDAAGEMRSVHDSPALARIAHAVALSNDATLRQHEGAWVHDGDAVDVALLTFARKAGFDPEAARRAARVTATIPFESEHAFAATFHEQAGRTRVVVKGALEALLPRCEAMRSEGVAAPLDEAAVTALGDALTDEGFRVLAVAEGEPTRVDPDSPELPALTLLGLVALIDPARPEAKAAVAECREAGIGVAMVTGDHPRTALAIARELGIATEEAEVVTGAQFAAAGPPDGRAAEALVAGGRVFARVAPLQKLHIVRAMRRLGHFVAVTGDGVNDAPALKAANIGVAMGSGSDVTKDTASLIVTDDDFASIVAGVEEGRFAYDNIRKVVLLVVSSGAAEVLLLLLALAFGLPLPLLAVQLLWLNLVTNGIQDISLAFEAGEEDAMARRPRRPSEGIFDALMIQQTVLGGLAMGGLAFAIWWGLLASGVEEAAARNELLLLFVLMQNVHVFSCRSERRSAFRVPLRRNLVLVGGVATAQGLHLLAMHLPLTQAILGVRPVSLSEWGLAVGAALSILLVMEMFKLVRSLLVPRSAAPRP